MRTSSPASTSIAHRKASTLYKRVGKRYVPVSDPWAYDGLREGAWFVQVRPGSTSIRQAVWPDRMEVQAALSELEDQLMDLLREATKARPAKALLTPAEHKAWQHLMKVGGESFSTIHYDSLQGIADAVLGKVKAKLAERGAVDSHGDDDEGCPKASYRR